LDFLDYKESKNEKEWAILETPFPGNRKIEL
jgi:hypothetical protein